LPDAGTVDEAAADIISGKFKILATNSIDSFLIISIYNNKRATNIRKKKNNQIK